MLRIAFLCFSVVAALRRSSICQESVCRRCSVVVYSEMIIDKHASRYCRIIMDIENCCNRFFGSSNSIGPVIDQTGENDGQHDEFVKTLILAIGLGIILVAIGIIGAVFYCNHRKSNKVVFKTLLSQQSSTMSSSTMSSTSSW